MRKVKKKESPITGRRKKRKNLSKGSRAKPTSNKQP